MWTTNVEFQSAPLHLDVDTEDTGYGDLRTRRNGELVVVSYHGSFAEAAVKQYVVKAVGR